VVEAGSLARHLQSPARTDPHASPGVGDFPIGLRHVIAAFPWSVMRWPYSCLPWPASLCLIGSCASHGGAQAQEVVPKCRPCCPLGTSNFNGKAPPG